MQVCCSSPAPALLLLGGGWLVVHGYTTLGTVIAFVTVLGIRFAMSLQACSGHHT